MRFEFATALRIIFGAGTLSRIGSIASEMGRHALVVTNQTTAGTARLLDELTAHDIDYDTFSVTGEPTTAAASEATDHARQAKCELVIGFGGGSALDAGKAVAALLANGGEPEDYLEVIGKGKALTRPSAPYIAIPTTAGTGSEVTSNAVLASPEHRIKVSMRSPVMLARLALVDPELTYSLPPELTASTGLDALTQLIEPYVSKRSGPVTDALCREGMRRVARSLARAFERSDNEAAREDMALASLLGGMALANAGLGAVHALAGPVGGLFHAPHGAVCARLLPHVMAANVKALQKRQPQSEALQRYGEISRILTGRETIGVDDGVIWVAELCDALGIPSLTSYGISPEDFPLLTERAASSTQIKSNPIELTSEEMEEILGRSITRSNV